VNLVRSMKRDKKDPLGMNGKTRASLAKKKMVNIYIQNCHIILGPTIFSLTRLLDHFFFNLIVRRVSAGRA
jgi:hypothetical protein